MSIASQRLEDAIRRHGNHNVYKHFTMRRILRGCDELPKPTSLQTVSDNEFNALIWGAVYSKQPFRTSILEYCKTLQIGRAVYVCFY